MIDFADLYEPATIEKKAKELLRVMRDWNILGNKLPLSTSIGITLYPQDGTDIRKLLKYADSAMYRAKEKGRNNYQFF
ncbi:MAG: diguanylate cyclase domain-containing protein [Ectobacillus sp.]